MPYYRPGPQFVIIYLSSIIGVRGLRVVWTLLRMGWTMHAQDFSIGETLAHANSVGFEGNQAGKNKKNEYYPDLGHMSPTLGRHKPKEAATAPVVYLC